MPELFIITGSNGAGKSTVGPDYLPQHLKSTLFDGDKLFMNKRSEYWRSGISSHKECKKLAAEYVEEVFEKLVETALKNKQDFAYEGHFTNHSTWEVPQKFKNTGYSIHLIFFGLKDIRLSALRVIARSREGGHYVDPLTLESNYYGNLEKLDIYYRIFDSVNIIDTSGLAHTGLVILKNGKCISAISADSLPDWFQNNLPAIKDEIIRFQTIDGNSNKHSFES